MRSWRSPSSETKTPPEQHLLDANRNLRQLLEDISIPSGIREALAPEFAEIEALSRKLRDEEVHIAAFGRVGAGKSSLLNALLGELFEEFDAILTPATTGEAPLGLDSTGNPIFCTLWTLCGTPAISLPLLQGCNDMPMGVQLVGARGDDTRLLRTAGWLARRLAEPPEH